MGSKTAGSVGGVDPQMQQQQMGDVPAFPMPQMQPMPGAPMQPMPGGAAPAGMGDVNYYGNSVLPFGGDQRAIEDALRLAQQQMGQSAPGGNTFQADLGRPDLPPPTPFPPGYKGSGINPELEKLYGTGMFVPPEVSGRRSSLNPFYRPDMKPTDAKPFQADLGRPDLPPGPFTPRPSNPFLPRPGMSPVKPVSPIPPPMGDTGPLRPKRPINPLLPAGYGFDPRGKRQDMGLTPPAGFPQGLDYNKMPPSVRDMFAPRPAQPAPKPQITNQGPGIGLAPPALPAGLDYNTMPPSVRSMFAPRR